MTDEEIKLWKRKEKEEYEFLDSIDVRSYLKDGADVTDVMHNLRKDHNREYCEKYNDDYGFFNYTGTDDFLDYILKRYKDIRYYESTNYYIYNPVDKEKEK